MAQRPEVVSDLGMYSLKVEAIHKEVASSLINDGYFFFSSSKQILDTFGLAFDKKDTQEAINNLISMSKEMQALECDMLRFGFLMIDKEAEIVALTYTIQSKKHNNQPLEVKESFTLNFPILALINHFAELWNNAYTNRPTEEIKKVAAGQ